jgi:CubicO group peptidase (beta-lactamase class C family)
MKRNHCFLIIPLIVAVVIACNHPENKADNSLASFILQKADSLYKSENVPGIFIGVLDNGKRSYYNVGYADPDKKMPFDSATLFEIGSITKTFTAYVLERVLKEKGISDSSPVISYLPDSLKANQSLKGISFLSLLNHTSGLPRLPDNMDLFSDFMTPYDHYTADQLFTYLKTCTPAPDGKSNYSNLGMGLAGVLAERIAGRGYFELLDQYIFTPFGLGKANKNIEGVRNKGQGYFENNKAAYWNMNVLGPAYILKSSAVEMLTYFQYMANPSDSIAKQVIDKLLAPTVTLTRGMNVCRAWHTIEQKDAPVIYWHNGSTYGFSTFGAFIKGQNKAVIVVTNRFNKSVVSDALGIIIMKKIST